MTENVQTVVGPLSILADHAKKEEELSGQVSYHLTGQHVLAQAEAFEVILKHEKISYTRHNAAPNGGIAFFMARADKDKVQRVIHEWYCAIHPLHKEVWSK